MNRYDMFHGHSSPHQLMTRSSMAVFTCVATRSANRRGPAETAATLKKKPQNDGFGGNCSGFGHHNFGLNQSKVGLNWQ